MCLSNTYRTEILKNHTLAENHDIIVKGCKSQIEDNFEKRITATPEIECELIYDNLDFGQETHNQGTNYHKLLHWCHRMAVKDRVHSSQGNGQNLPVMIGIERLLL